jgi:site-specific DNA-methyltransferase (adenine-specific)
LGEGILADPFMGSGSTVAACEALNLQSIGVERHAEYFEMAKNAIPRLSSMESDADEALEPLDRV